MAIQLTMVRSLLLNLQSNDDNKALACREIARRLELSEGAGESLDDREIWRLKLQICKEFKLETVPKNADVLAFISPGMRKKFERRLRRKSIRTVSGIAVVTLITMPFDCPHGTCTFCPGGVRFGTPQSYTKNSPAAAFGMARDYDPQKQVSDMITFLDANGHDTSKVELILLGGTILAMPKGYQLDFVKNSYNALNSGVQSDSLQMAMKLNETSVHRCVGLTIETKPDWCRPSHVDTLLSYGTTRVEIGVQSLREEVLKLVNRGHTLSDTIESFRVSKDSGLKLVAHMMPGLPGSDPDKDVEDLLQLFENEKYRPDMLKIYPTLVVEGTALYQQFKLGRYKPYSLDQLKEILCKFKSQVPPWVRIMRIQREIPKEEIVVGTKAGNLRQIILDEMTERNLECRCIRCREVGHRTLEMKSTIVLKRIDYQASSGEEIFLSYEAKETGTLHGFLRLRIPSGLEHRPEIIGTKSALVREIHVYGPVVPIGEQTRDSSQSQHRGLGSLLLREAERISKEEFSKSKIIVISAVGTREYYRKRGYLDDGVYVSKLLD
ncbi:MAG: tRNA uridine(34) 5-carboxymethylaminomethyl modification radical SAM/GNAT enzyme Elp3 [Thaumarchaeota archaeon]|nr:tRNA uridine(34) 5-carboxymethylaminomethyl modification radical SAM/GNAT enzyme Elp3 [Nitrososphaerota archaeon]